MDLVGYDFPQLEISLDEYALPGPVLDIGGGGEGVIGQLLGWDVIAIDHRLDELLETPDGHDKVMMDARRLGFSGQFFPTLTAFFSLMYIPKREDQITVFAEAQRVLQPGGSFHLWDVTLPAEPLEGSDYFVVSLRYGIRGKDAGHGLWDALAGREAGCSSLHRSGGKGGIDLCSVGYAGPLFLS